MTHSTVQEMLRVLKVDEKQMPSRKLDEIWKQCRTQVSGLWGSDIIQYNTNSSGFELSIDDTDNIFEYLRFLRGICPRDVKMLLEKDKKEERHGLATVALSIQKKIWNSDGVFIICESKVLAHNMTYGDYQFSPKRITEYYTSPLYFVSTFNKKPPLLVTEILGKYCDTKQIKIVHLVSIVGGNFNDMFFGDGFTNNSFLKTLSQKYDIFVIDLKRDDQTMKNYLLKRSFRSLFDDDNKTWLIYVRPCFEKMEDIIKGCLNNEPIVSSLSLKVLKADMKKRKINGNDSVSMTPAPSGTPTVYEKLHASTNTLKKLCVSARCELNKCYEELTEIDKLADVLDKSLKDGKIPHVAFTSREELKNQINGEEEVCTPTIMSRPTTPPPTKHKYVPKLLNNDFELCAKKVSENMLRAKSIFVPSIGAEFSASECDPLSVSIINDKTSEAGESIDKTSESGENIDKTSEAGENIDNYGKTESNLDCMSDVYNYETSSEAGDNDGF